MKNYLSQEELLGVLKQFDASEPISVERVRSHNRGEIRNTLRMNFNEFQALVLDAIEEGHQPGGDLEVVVPKLNKKLVGHHDGIYWLEDL
jgi:hypothetical protein